MATATPTYDVFLSHSSRDREFAVDIAERLKADGLQPFHDASVPVGKEVSKAIWEALAECHAFIVIVSPDSTPDAMGMVELGAATAWHKPIFVVLNGPASSRLPAALKTYQAFPRNRLDEVLNQIRRNLEPLSDDDREKLAKIYSELNVSADRYGQSPRELQDLVKKFKARSKKQISGTRLLSELLRMRKQSKLPRLPKPRRITM